jgi:putative membrane protein
MLRSHLITAAALCIAAFATVGCEQTISGLGGKPSSQIPIGESHYFKVAANSNQQLVKMSQLALDRSHNDQIRQFAQREIDEHNNWQQNLGQLAGSKDAQLPTSLGNIELGTVNDLAAQKDADFDKAYVQAVIGAHQNAINDTNAEAMNGADADVKAYSQKQLTELQKHLAAAKDLPGAPQQ